MSDKPLILHTCSVGPWPMNSYALICPETGESVLIDPGAEPEALLAMLDDSRAVAIVLTHTHPDHIGALEVMRARLGVPVLAHPGPHWQGMTAPVDGALAEGEMVRVGAHRLRVYHAPGHIDDQLCLVLEGDNRAIVGDTIFEGGPGATWSSEGFQTTRRTLREVVLPWPDATICYPGHGPAFRLGDIRAAVEGFLQHDHGDFFGDGEWGMGKDWGLGG